MEDPVKIQSFGNKTWIIQQFRNMLPENSAKGEKHNSSAQPDRKIFYIYSFLFFFLANLL